MAEQNQLDAISSDLRWTAAERIAASQNFSKSGRLRIFLLHIVQCTIEGRTEDLTEQQLGVQVFGRAAGYNPSDDNIVRSAARQLRQRLALYYQEEGLAERIRIQVPRGGYVPIFSSADAPVLEATTVEAPAPAPLPEVRAVDVEEPLPPKAPARFHTNQLWKYAAALLLGSALTVFIDRVAARPHHFTSATEPLWSEIFSTGRTTIFVPGDAGLNLYNIFSGRTQQLSLSEVLNKDLPPLQMENLDNKQVHSSILWAYVPISDLKLANQITKIDAFRGDHYEMRNVRDLTPDSFQDASAILSGAPPYNPWVELFDSKLNFHFVYNSSNNSMRVINRQPQQGEQPSYLYQTDPDHEHGYGYIALTDNVEGNGKVLLIEGTSLIGVDAAASFLFNEKKMAPILARAKNSQGKLANFEVLLEAPFLKLNAGDVSVVATRIYPNN